MNAEDSEEDYCKLDIEEDTFNRDVCFSIVKLMQTSNLFSYIDICMCNFLLMLK
jgi:hypothetical protein